MSASMEDERIAERGVLLVLHGAPLRMRREELAEGARFALAGMPAVVKPVVEKQDRAILQDWRERGERVSRRLVESAIKVRERDRGMDRSKCCRPRSYKRSDARHR